MQTIKPLEDRFWEKVDRGAPDDCWEWKGQRNRQGYGIVALEGRVGKYQPRTMAHRASLMLAGVRIAGKLVCHHCDNPPCVNPSHLFVGTDQDNYDDSVRKGRRRPGANARGEACKTKLSNQDVLSIRGLAAAGISQLWLAKAFSISKQSVSMIVTRKRWSHI